MLLSIFRLISLQTSSGSFTNIGLRITLWELVGGMNQWGCQTYTYVKRGTASSELEGALIPLPIQQHGGRRSKSQPCVCPFNTAATPSIPVNTLEPNQRSFSFLVQGWGKRTKQIRDQERGQRCCIRAFSFLEALYSTWYVFNSDIYIKSSVISWFSWCGSQLTKFIYYLRGLWVALSQGRKRLHNKGNTSERRKYDETRNSQRKYTDWGTGTLYIIERVDVEAFWVWN